MLEVKLLAIEKSSIKSEYLVIPSPSSVPTPGIVFGLKSPNIILDMSSVPVSSGTSYHLRNLMASSADSAVDRATVANCGS